MLWPAKIAALEAQVASLTSERDAATGQTATLQERITALEAAGENSPALTAAREQVTTLEGEKASLTGQLTAAFSQVEAYKGAAGTAGHFTFEGTAEKPVIALTEAGKTAFINAGITAALAAAGHAALPIAATVDSVTAAKTDDKNPDAIRERAVAATNAQVASFLTAYNTQK